MKFIDEILIRARSGRGGAGLCSFRSAKNAPKLGADGGDGGFGGHVFFKGNSTLNTLSHLYYMKVYAAGDGERGGPNGRTGANGRDCIIEVPVGTIVYNAETEEVMGEVLEDGELVQLAEGGKRGLGNLRYVSSTHQAPEEHTSGGEGMEFHLKLELKLIADAGFAGFPNAGKSTLLSTISAAQPKVADYPFTTLEPQLGVVDVSEQTGEWGKSFVAADIPGLIEGASEGKGLGHEFLRHLERTKVIVFVIDAFPFDETTPFEAFNKLKSELANYGSELSEKKFLVLLTKLDLAPPEFDWSTLTKPFTDCGLECLKISSLSRSGLGEAKLKIWQIVEKERLLIKKEDAVSSVVSVQDRSEEFKLLTERYDEDLGL